MWKEQYVVSYQSYIQYVLDTVKSILSMCLELHFHKLASTNTVIGIFYKLNWYTVHFKKNNGVDKHTAVEHEQIPIAVETAASPLLSNCRILFALSIWKLLCNCQYTTTLWICVALYERYHRLKYSH